MTYSPLLHDLRYTNIYPYYEGENYSAESEAWYREETEKGGSVIHSHTNFLDWEKTRPYYDHLVFVHVDTKEFEHVENRFLAKNERLKLSHCL